MNLTKDTTEEQITAPVLLARTRLATLATDPDTDPDLLLSAAHGVWEQVAVAKVRWEIVGLLKHYGGDSVERDRALRNLFVGILCRGADDKWSGRTNDARRIAHDAVLQEINDLRYSLIRGN